VAAGRSYRRTLGAPTSTTTERNITMRRTIIPLALAGALLAGCGGGGSGSLGGGKLTLHGTFTLQDDEDAYGPWNDCSGKEGYDDFGPGMNVTVKDGDGKIVGTGDTEPLPARWKLDDRANAKEPKADGEAQAMVDAALADDKGYCTVYIEVPIKKAEFYSVTIGRRGDLSYSYDDLSKKDFWIESSLGGS
jgi:hypothetical protein